MRDNGIVPHVFTWHIISWQQINGLANAVMRLFTHTHIYIHFINKFVSFIQKMRMNERILNIK